VPAGLRPGRDPDGAARWAEVAAGVAGLLWSLASGCARLPLGGAEAAPPAALALSRYLLLSLVAVPWLLAAVGFLAGLRWRGFGALAPLLFGAAGLAADALAPARPLPAWPVLLLGLAVLLRARRVPAHPMAYLGVFGAGFVLTVLGHVAWVTILLTAPRP